MQPGRPLEFDPERALDAAMTVFWERGFEATSLADLLAAMRLSKSSFYNAFGSKQQVFEACLGRFRQRQVQGMRERLAAAHSPREFLRAMLFSAAAEAGYPTPPRGCLIMNTATEFAGRDRGVAVLVSGAADDFAGVFRSAIERGQEQGEVSSGASAEVLGRYLVTVVAGLRTMAKAGLAVDEIEQVAEVALKALD